METNITLITGLFSLLIAVLSMGYSHITRIRVLKAEESAKQSEQIRIQALKGIEEITHALGGLAVLFNSMSQARVLKSYDSPKDFIAEFNDMIHKYRKQLGEAHFRFIIYLTSDISNEIESIEEQIQVISLDPEKLSRLSGLVKSTLQKIKRLSNEKYLSLSGNIDSA